MASVCSGNVNFNFSIYIAHRPSNALGALVPCEQKCFQLPPESGFCGIRVANGVWEAVPCGQSSNGESPMAVRAKLVQWYWYI